MSDFSSFAHDENELAHRFRNDLSRAESSEDVKKFFVYTVQKLLNRALGDADGIRYDDISLGADDGSYTLSARLLSDQRLHRALAGSDLKAILQRFAVSAQHRVRHLDGHPEKSQAKIRGH